MMNKENHNAVRRGDHKCKGVHTLIDAIIRVQDIRAEIPSTTTRIYLNTGTFGPLPQRSVQTVQERYNRELYEGRLAPTFLEREDIYHEARKRIAELLNAECEEIALTNSTSEGLNIICYGLNWQAGDEVIVTDHEHNSALAPLYRIKQRYGITIRCAELGLYGERSAAEMIQPLISPSTRLIVISHISFKTGSLLDIQAVATLAHRSGITMLVDGAQAAGAIPLDMKQLDVDFYTIPMQKWLCGPDGGGALYARKSAQQVQPSYSRFFSIKDQLVAWTHVESAQRFEWGGRQTAAVAGQVASLRWLAEDVGFPWIYQRIAQLNAYAFEALQTLPDVSLLTSVPRTSGILSFQFRDANPDTMIERLRVDHNIHMRSIKDRQALRICTGFYNTKEEIDRLVQVLRTM